MKVVNENGVDGLVVEGRLPMWPELYKYYRHKAKIANAKTPQEHKEIEKAIIQEIKDSGFKMVYYRIPTEYPYSFVRIEIKEFTNIALGSGIELPDEFVSQTGADLDGDAIFGMISSLNFKNGKVELISPGLDSPGARQSLITAIFDQTIGKSPKDQLISAEDNVLKVRGKNTMLPELKIGTPASNKRAFELNNMDVIGAAAIVNSSSWFLRGTRLTINTKTQLPKLDKDYGTSLSDEIIKDDQTKYTQGNTVVQAGVDMPKEATFTKLGFNEEMVKVLMFMTDVMTVDMDYALDFLQHPAIKRYRKEVEAITDDKKEFSHRQKVWKIEESIMGTSKNFFVSDINPDATITQEEIKEGKRGAEVLWKYLELKRQTSNYAKFNITLSKILKPGDGNPEKLFSLLHDLKDLHKMYEGMESLLPAIEINTATGKKIFKKERESSSEWINANYDAILAKLAIADSISYYFTPEFQKVYDMFKTYNNVNFFNEDINEFHDLFYRYVFGRTVSPVASYLHLGMEAAQGSNISYKEDDNYSLNYIRRKIIGLKNELLLQDNLDSEKIREYSEMLYTLSYYTINEKKGEFKKNGKIEKVGILKMASGIYDDEIVTNIQKGFMTMITNEDPEIKKFAKDVRDFSIFTGWSRGNNNVGGYIPRDAWGIDAPSYNSTLRESFRTMNSNKLSLAIMKHNPRKYTRKIWQKFGKDANGKNLFYFTPVPNTTVIKTGEKKSNGDEIFFNRQIQLNPFYFIDNNIQFDVNGKAIGLPFYFNMKAGSKIGLYRADENHKILTLVSFNSFPDVFDIQQDGAMSTDSLYIPEKVPMEEGPKIVAPIQEAQPVKNKKIEKPYPGVENIPDTGLTIEKANEFIDLLQPQILNQAYVENKAYTANRMFSFGLRWAKNIPNDNEKSIQRTEGLKQRPNKVKLQSLSSYDSYGYYATDQNNKPLPPLSSIQPIIDFIESQIGIDLSDYDSVLANIYEPNSFIHQHRDTTESKTAKNYPVVVINLGAKGGLLYHIDFSDETKYNANSNTYNDFFNQTDKHATLPIKNGGIYAFGVDGKNRFSFNHRVQAEAQETPTKPLVVPEWDSKGNKIGEKTLNDYRITLTFRRAQDLTENMPKTPKRLSVTPNTPSQVQPNFNKYLNNAIAVKTFNWNRESAIIGTDADVAMRKDADGFIGEGIKENSSTITSSKEIAAKLKLPVRQLRRVEPGKPVYLIGYTVNIGEDKTTPTKVMLARNGILKGKELKEDTKQAIRRANFQGATFILGDMIGVDTVFMDYLIEIGAKYEIYGHDRLKTTPAYKTQEELSKMPLLERLDHAKKTLPINAEKVGMSPEVVQELLDKLETISTMEEFLKFVDDFKKRCHGNMSK